MHPYLKLKIKISAQQIMTINRLNKFNPNLIQGQFYQSTIIFFFINFFKFQFKMSKTKLPSIKLLLSIFIILTLTHSLHLRLTTQHQQIATFADVINNSNHVNSQLSLDPIRSSQNSSNSTPKVAVAIVVPIICIGLCCIFCFFCLQCAKNQQQQAEKDLTQTIPCYCGPIKCIAKCCRYLLCIDILLRCFGLRSTNWEKKEKERLKVQELKKQKENKQSFKQYKQRQKQEKKYGLPDQSKPYDEQANPLTSIWALSGTFQGQSVKKLKCQLCEGKVKKNSDTTTLCSKNCVFHLQCLVNWKNSNNLSKISKLCPSCKEEYLNIVKFYCKKCWNKYTKLQIQSGNLYVSHLSVEEAIKSVGGEKCDQCAKKKWFWQ